jgi:hypothetical protein
VHGLVLELLAREGPEGVWLARLAREMGHHRSWGTRRLISQEEVLRRVVAREVEGLCAQLALLKPSRNPKTHIRRVAEALLGPPKGFRARLWVLQLASRFGLGAQGGALARSIAQALTGNIQDDTPAIGGGILGVIGEALGPWNPSREQLLETVIRMTLAVHFFEVAARRAGRV